MRDATPSLNAIRAFEAAARHESFARAADELGVSSSAVSQQVSQLEADLGITLFERVKQRLKLTSAGQTYSHSLSKALDRIESATTDLVSNKGIQPLRIGSLPSLADYWLIPRIPQFIQTNPQIKLHIVSLTLDFAAPLRAPNFQGGRIDVGLFYGDGHWQGLDATKFMNEQLVPIASPHLIGTNIQNESEADAAIESLPLLQHSTRPNSWEEWFRFRQTTPQLAFGPSFEHFHMLIHAAKAGIGIALVPLTFIESELEKAELIRIGNQTLNSERGYYVVTDPSGGYKASVSALRDWLVQQSPQIQ